MLVDATPADVPMQPSASWVARGPVINAEFMLESLVCDFQWTALAVGTVTHILNAWGQAGTEWTPRSCRHLLHDDHQVILLSLRFASDMGLPNDTAVAIGDFHEKLARAKAQCAPLIQMASQSRRPERHRLTELTAPWKAYSRSASALLSGIQSKVGDCLPREYDQNARVLARFLEEAAQGRFDRVNPKGDIQLPELAQRRRSVRVPVNMSCSALASGSAWPAALKDVSKTGLRFSTDGPVAEQQRLTIALPDQRRLSGTVVWKKGDLHGLALATPISSRDPLLMRAKT
jgi:hypothetical protein